ncbi:MAG TPA: TetR/AcrR family transcriptional regulator [Candidatus Nanopelagicales bacterium]|nr:TetR/AcrR family transcriptional regulator [Candidatus Nanopelagicales bacterium]
MSTHPTSVALHHATVGLLETRAERDVTVEKVLAASGASKGSLYHHFRDFDSLLDRAQATRFAQTVDRTLALLGSVSARDAVVVDLLVALAAGTLCDEDDAVRQELLAIAVRRPSLQVLLGPEQQRLADALAALLRDAQSRRWVRTDVDAHDTALLLLSCAAGRVVARVADVPSWEQLIAAVLHPVLEPPAAAAIPDRPHDDRLDASTTREPHAMTTTGMDPGTRGG